MLSSSCSLWMMPSYWSHSDKEEVVGFRENQPLTQQASVSGPRGKDHDREKTYTSQEMKSRMGTLVRLDARSLEEVTQGPKYSVQFSHSVVSNCLRHDELQHTRLPCPSPTPGVYSNSCPSSR